MQKRLNYQICLRTQDNNMNAVTALENKEYVKFWGTLILVLHPRDETAMLVYKTIENGPTSFA